MIEKIIHYCWFGNKKMPKKYKTFISTWKKFFPNYEIIEWNEKNFPINKYPFAQAAYDSGKYAFVSDVARMYALYNYGGIYFDTDVEVIKSMDDLLTDDVEGVLGEESIEEQSFGTGFIALKKHHKIAKHFLEYYNSHTFSNDSLSLKPNTHILADFLKEYYFIEPNGIIKKVDNISIYPQYYFTCFDGFIGKTIITNDSKCIHHFDNSWTSKKGKIIYKIRLLYHRLLRILKIK